MMNVVNSGARYQIYGEEVKTYNHLPIGSYEVAFNKMTGFFLVSRPDLVVNEEKVYGNHEQRVSKVLRSFNLSNRNFGIILSGQKGIGKSLFARLLAKKSLESCFPVITVTGYIPGIADFLGSIEQEVVVIFDEFEKTFPKKDDCDTQEDLLSLFDGLDNGKKLFVITCNETQKLNSYLLNRPGRFHYHFIISNPSDEEVSQYMHDKLKKEYWSVIDRVLKLSKTINVTYDYLRALVFELNQGYTLEEALGDLNITKAYDVHFDVVVTLNNGMTLTRNHCHIDFYNDSEDNCIWLYGRNNFQLAINFNVSDVNFEGSEMWLEGSDVKLRVDEEDFPKLNKEEFAELVDTLKVSNVKFIKCNYSDGNKINLMV